jgi:hypothetical protein
MRNPFLKAEQSGGSFLPQEYVARKNEMRANLVCLSLFGVVMFGVVAAFFVTNRQWLQVKAQQKSVTVQYTQEGAKIEQYKRLEAQKSEMMDKAEITTALVEKVPRSKLMSEVVTRMPKDITLLEVQLIGKRIKDVPGQQQPAAMAPGAIKTLGGKPSAQISGAKIPAAPPPSKERISAPRLEFTLKLIGVARVNQDVSDYLTSLKACSILENVDLKIIKETTIEKLDLRRFEIEASIRKDADARGLEHVDLRTLTVGGVPGTDPTRAGGAPGNVSISNVPEKKD